MKLSNMTTLEKAHAEIDRIYFDIFPKHGMEVRDGQIALCHNMLNAFADKRISLCHAGVGVGKTSAYIVAAVVWNKYRPCDASEHFSPFVIATSSIALQNAILEDYIPQLSDILCGEGVIDEPFEGILRKGKGNYVCPMRLARRIENINPDKRNKEKLKALLALRLNMDLGKAPRLSKYDKVRVAIPDTCPRKCKDADDCAFIHMLTAQQHSTVLFQVCNHNYFLADALNRMRGYAPLLPAYRGVVIDEAHKLAAAAREMCEYRFDKGDVGDFLAELRMLTTAPRNGSALFDSLFAQFEQASNSQDIYSHSAERKELMRQCLEVLEQATAIRPSVSGLHNAANRIGRTLKQFYDMSDRYLCYLDCDREGNLTFVAIPKSIRTQLRTLLWDNKDAGMILTSGTLAINKNFRFIRRQMGLNHIDRVIDESVIHSPFDYQNNCLLYLPEHMPGVKDADAYRAAAFDEITKLINATHGHTLILFTSYDDMSETYQMLKEQDTPYPLFALNRKDEQSLTAFRRSGNGVLLACGRAWEGLDFPGDIVSSLILYKLPFPQKTLLSEAQKSQYMSLRDFIGAVVVPQMQISVMQGIGRGIRLESDTCVISILDRRATSESKYQRPVMEVLPYMPTTHSIDEVIGFIAAKKQPGYFESGVTADGTADAQ